MPRAKSAEEVLDSYLNTASKDKLMRLYSDVRACRRFKHGMFNDGEETPAKRAYTKKKATDGDKQPVLPGAGNGASE